MFTLRWYGPSLAVVHTYSVTYREDQDHMYKETELTPALKGCLSPGHSVQPVTGKGSNFVT